MTWRRGNWQNTVVRKSRQLQNVTWQENAARQRQTIWLENSRLKLVGRQSTIATWVYHGIPGCAFPLLPGGPVDAGCMFFSALRCLLFCVSGLGPSVFPFPSCPPFFPFVLPACCVFFLVVAKCCLFFSRFPVVCCGWLPLFPPIPPFPSVRGSKLTMFIGTGGSKSFYCYRKGGDTNKMDKFLYPRMCVCVYVCVFVCACLYYIPLVTSGCVGQNIFNDFCKLRKFKQEAVKAFVGSLLRRRLPHSH